MIEGNMVLYIFDNIDQTYYTLAEGGRGGRRATDGTNVSNTF